MAEEKSDNEAEIKYYCHSCERNVTEVEETDDGCLKCIVCNDEYVEIAQSDEEEEEEKKNDVNNNNGNGTNVRNNSNFQFIRNGNTSVFYTNVNGPQALNNMNHIFANLFGMNGNGNRMNINRIGINGTFGDYAVGDISNIISSLGLNGQKGPPPASKEVVKALKEFTFNSKEDTEMKSDQNDEVDKTCPVCKDKFVDGDVCKLMPCDHLYHKDCIEQWLKHANNCPVCRYRLKTDDAFYEQMNANNNTQQQQQQNEQQ